MIEHITCIFMYVHTTQIILNSGLSFTCIYAVCTENNSCQVLLLFLLIREIFAIWMSVDITLEALNTQLVKHNRELRLRTVQRTEALSDWVEVTFCHRPGRQTLTRRRPLSRGLGTGQVHEFALSVVFAHSTFTDYISTLPSHKTQICILRHVQMANRENFTGVRCRMEFFSVPIATSLMLFITFKIDTW